MIPPGAPRIPRAAWILGSLALAAPSGACLPALGERCLTPSVELIALDSRGRPLGELELHVVRPGGEGPVEDRLRTDPEGRARLVGETSFGVYLLMPGAHVERVMAEATGPWGLPVVVDRVLRSSRGLGACRLGPTGVEVWVAEEDRSATPTEELPAGSSPFLTPAEHARLARGAAYARRRAPQLPPDVRERLLDGLDARIDRLRRQRCAGLDRTDTVACREVLRRYRTDRRAILSPDRTEG